MNKIARKVAHCLVRLPRKAASASLEVDKNR